jgi:hypothetical protein
MDSSYWFPVLSVFHPCFIRGSKSIEHCGTGLVVAGQIVDRDSTRLDREREGMRPALPRSHRDQDNAHPQKGPAAKAAALQPSSACIT